jgi:adiponectin receptor
LGGRLPQLNPEGEIADALQRRVPESLYPGAFDIWGHSHTIWHVFVTLSIGAHVIGLLHALEYSYSHTQCR